MNRPLDQDQLNAAVEQLTIDLSVCPRVKNHKFEYEDVDYARFFQEPVYTFCVYHKRHGYMGTVQGADVDEIVDNAKQRVRDGSLCW